MSASARPSKPPPEAAPAKPPRRRRGWLRWLAGLLVLLLVLPPLAVAGALLWANSESGRDSLARLVEGFVPGLELRGLQGPLPGRLALDHVALADAEGVWLEVEQASLAWDPYALLRGEAHITRLAAERVTLHRLPAADPDAPPEPPGPLLPELPSLPVGIVLDRLEVRRIALGAALLGEPAELRATGAARLDDGGLTAELAAESPEAGTLLALDAALRPASGRLQARLRLRGAAGGPVARLVGLPGRAPELDLTLDGPPEGAALTLRAAAGPGLSATLDGTVRAPDLAHLGAELTGRLDASGLLEGPLAALAGPLDLRLVAARGPDGRIVLDALRLTGAAGELAAEGRLDPASEQVTLRLDASLASAERFAALLPTGLVGWDALTLQASAEGPLAAPRIEADLAVQGFRSDQAPLAALLGPTPRLALRGTPRLEGTPAARIDLLTLTGAALQAELRGLAGETLDLHLAAEVAAVEGATPGVSGALRLTATASGPLADPDLTVNAASGRLEVAGQVLEALDLAARIAHPASAPAVQATLSGRFQGLPLGLELRGGPAPDGALRLEAATARLGPATLEAEGRILPDLPGFEGRAVLAVPELAPLSAIAGQPLAGSLRLEATGAVRDGQQRLTATLTAPRLVAAGTTLRELEARLEGGLDAAEFALSGRAFDATLELRGQQAAQPDGTRRIELAALRLAGHGETIRLAAPARLLLRPDGKVEIAALALTGTRGATLRAEGSYGPERADLRASLALPDLALFSEFLPDLQPRGRLTAEARITGRANAPEVQATLRGTGLGAGGASLRGLPAAELQAEATRAADGAITARAQLGLGQATRLNATARLPRGAAGPLEASLEGQADVGALAGPLLAAGANRVSGRATLALRAGGTVAAPVLGGEARLAGIAWRNAELGAAITDLGGTLRAEGERLRLDLTGRTAGEGRIALAGTVAPLAPGLPLDLTLRATQAQPVSSDLLRLTLDADLQLAGALQSGATLRGPVRLRRAEIRIPEQLPSSVRSLGPVTERGRPPGLPLPPPPAPRRRDEAGGPAVPGLPIALDVRLQAPQNVFVRGRGVDAELGGTLHIGGQLAAPEINGELALRRGDVRLLARRIAFDRGRLDFSGSLLPELDFRASSQTGSTTVRVEITGPPTAPVITFSSTPELPQDEVLARLLFDRPVRELSPFELAQIAQALAGATGIAGGGATGVLERVRQTLGLDRLAVGGGGEGASRATSAEERRGATLEAGRYVADGVYVGVKQGTEPGSARVGVRVDLTPRLRLEAETGDREAGERVGVSMEWEWGR